MRTIIVTFFVAMLVAACISTPELYPIGDGADAGSSPSAVSDSDSAPPGTDDDAASDATVAEDDAATDEEDATTVPPEPPPPPPSATCPPSGSPAGALCCGAGNTPPVCKGLACSHCSDCVAKGCGTGSVCCAISPGGSGKYKGMTCALNGLAGLCP